MLALEYPTSLLLILLIFWWVFLETSYCIRMNPSLKDIETIGLVAREGSYLYHSLHLLLMGLLEIFITLSFNIVIGIKTNHTRSSSRRNYKEIWELCGKQNLSWKKIVLLRNICHLKRQKFCSLYWFNVSMTISYFVKLLFIN
mgnify:CR=1 FL=1